MRYKVGAEKYDEMVPLGRNTDEIRGAVTGTTVGDGNGHINRRRHGSFPATFQREMSSTPKLTHGEVLKALTCLGTCIPTVTLTNSR